MPESYHSAPTRHTIEWNLEDARKAQNFHRRFVLKGKGDIGQMTALLFQMSPDCYLDQFQSSGDKQVGLAYRCTAGKIRKSLHDPAGRGGRFIVATEGSYDFGTVFPSDFDLDFGDDRRAQYDPAVIGMFQAAFAEHCDGSPYFFKPERGEKYDQRLHAHTMTPRGTCSVGWHEARGPEDFLNDLAYMKKLPWYTTDNVSGHAEAYREREGKSVRRLRSGNLSESVTIGDVQLVLPHLSLLRPTDEESKPGSSVPNSLTDSTPVIERPVERERIVIVTQLAASLEVENPSHDPEPAPLVGSENSIEKSFVTEAKASSLGPEVWAILAEARRSAPAVPKPRILAYSLPGLRQLRPVEVDADAAAKSISRTAHLPADLPQLQVWSICTSQPVYALYEPENEYLGQSPPHFVPVSVMSRI